MSCSQGSSSKSNNCSQVISLTSPNSLLVMIASVIFPFLLRTSCFPNNCDDVRSYYFPPFPYLIKFILYSPHTSTFSLIEMFTLILYLKISFHAFKEKRRPQKLNKNKRHKAKSLCLKELKTEHKKRTRRFFYTYKICSVSMYQFLSHFFPILLLLILFSTPCYFFKQISKQAYLLPCIFQV